MAEGEFEKRIDSEKPMPEDAQWGTYNAGLEEAYDNCLDWIIEAKKEIFDSIEEHFQELVKAWRYPQKDLEQFKEYYLDALLCLQHNIVEEDVFKLKKWFGK